MRAEPGPGGAQAGIIEKITPLIEMILGIRVIDCGMLERASIIEKITQLLIGLNIWNKCQFGGIRITSLDKGKAC